MSENRTERSDAPARVFVTADPRRVLFDLARDGWRGSRFRVTIEHMKLAAIVVVLIACKDEPRPLDASFDRAPCEATYQAALDRTCQVPADCALVSHNDCCGVVRVAVHAGTEAAAESAETTYGACFECGARGCDHADEAEDGMTPQVGQSIVATCVANRCTSVVQ